MRYYRVLHNFNAEDNVELTVTKGEIVTSNDIAVQDGWIKVEVLNDTDRHGFVPYNYIRETTLSASNSPYSFSASVSAARAHSSESPGAPRNESPPRPIAGSGPAESPERAERPQPQPQPAESAISPPRGAREAEATPKSDADGFLLNDHDAVVEAFMKNELHFKHLMRQRQDALHQMRTTLKEAVTELSACKDKNAVLSSKLRELDQTVERERQKWKERIEEEKAFINRSIPRESSVAAPSQTSHTRSLGRY